MDAQTTARGRRSQSLPRGPDFAPAVADAQLPRGALVVDLKWAKLGEPGTLSATEFFLPQARTCLVAAMSGLQE